MHRYLIGNWKMNLPPEGVGPYLEALSGRAESGVRVVIAPPFPYLRDIIGIAAGAQNCAADKSGAFTGEVSPWMLADLGISHVIIGHSERRAMYGETDAIVQRKLAAAIEAGLVPVLCVGEDLRVREAGHVARFLAEQVKAAASPALEKASAIIVAYEPVWAIGTGRNASGVMCAETVAEIREALVRFWPERWASGAPILYGGSVTPDNVEELERDGAIDGYLVGGASLSSAKFLALYEAMRGA